MKKLIIIAGATASGKTAVSVKVAKRLDGEIISADSMQIYKTLDIGTAKATKSEMDGVIHHMIDIVSPNESYSVAEYSASGKKIIEDIFHRGKTPIICGGTGFYINSLIYAKSFGKTVGSDEIRRKYENILL
ncbi:MAG: isopentenyl transferase family protein [Clostridia bacterium]